MVSPVLGFDPRNVWINDSLSGRAEWVFTSSKQHNFEGQISTKYIEIFPLFKLKIQVIASDSRSITTADSSFGCSVVNFYLYNSLTKDKSVRLSAHQFLGSFAKLRKASISFITPVCLSLCLSVWLSAGLSARPHGTTRLSLGRFSWNLTFEDFFETLSTKFKFH